ncbi:hypothetical protein [Akkermansia glycaniphila]|uniref:Nucleotide-diphospho-sugar transferases n=2 Tax=Akkermansia glycaniphila TaxID=1679444 RepID=A0A1H6MHQ5_9BACT|nr:hypothetical protein [Akkermansia glycaniphila]SEH97383.1 nucleotide-diphospho-sugar transferases [Akkermansia glycaniphila]
MHQKNPTIISALWVGDELSPVAELSIRSFLDNGFAFQLFTYQAYANVPDGAIVRDASEIVSREEVYLHHSGSYGMFADLFRYTFLEREGGWWTDLDVACLNNRIPKHLPWFAQQETGFYSVGVLGFPAHHPAMEAMKRLAEDPAASMPWDDETTLKAKKQFCLDTPDVIERRKHVEWGYAGPNGFTRAVNHFGLQKFAAGPETLYPLNYTVWRNYFNGALHLNSAELASAWAVHLWGEMLRREPDAWENMNKESIVAELLRRHGMENCPGATSALQKKKVGILVGICSCCSAWDRRQAVRESWLQHAAPGIECKFFLGRRTPPAGEEHDTVALWVNDDYNHLPEKVLAFFRHALDHYEFEWLFKCDDDTYLKLDRLASLCNPAYGITGDLSLAERDAPSGGAGYLLSRSIVEKIVNTPDIRRTGAEDVIFGRLALQLGATPYATERLGKTAEYYPMPENQMVTAHWCSPDQLRAIEYFQQATPITIYEARHDNWQDTLYFFPDGRFRRKNHGDSGSYSASLDGRGLTLHWFRWEAETLVPCTCGDKYIGDNLTLRLVAGHPPLNECLFGTSRQ